MSIYISVVSHGHADIINKLCCLSDLADEFKVVVKSNTPNENLNNLATKSNFHWIDEQYGCGFGHNNNIVFDYCRSKIGMKDDDYFIAVNPDVFITSDAIKMLEKKMKADDISLAAINLFKDKNHTLYDNSIRQFPSCLHFVRSYIGFSNTSIIDKSIIHEPCKVDWAAGSFLAFKAVHYANLGGFDERYFMYCEDIDICYRSYKLDEQLTYYPSIKALHLASHANRSLFSKHFYWHVKSVIRFILTKNR